jgi:putative transposase
MIRRVKLNIDNANIGKLESLSKFIVEAKRVVNIFIDDLWERQDFGSKFIDSKTITWLSARMQQCLGKQALEIVKSQRKRKKKTKPVFKGCSFNLDSRFVGIQFDNNTFDIWIKLSSIGNKIILKLPARQHRQLHKYDTWKLKQSIRLRFSYGQYFIDLYYEKDKPEVKKEGKPKAIDIGYKKFIVSSDGEFIGNEKVYEKISRKKQGSVAFKRALKERDEQVNIACKQLDLSKINILYVEDLKSVKYKSKGKIRKQFNNKLQRWTYPKVLGKLSMLCEENGVQFLKLPPQYTSQRCSLCGVICESNRSGETYKCACGNSLDADYNAALNILHLGEYGPQAFQRGL